MKNKFTLTTRSLRLLALMPFFTVACVGGPGEAATGICLGVDDPLVFDGAGDGALALGFEGEVIGYRSGVEAGVNEGNIMPCVMPGGQVIPTVLAVEDGDGRAWFIGMGISDGMEWIWDPNLELEPGDRLRVEMRTDAARTSAGLLIWQGDQLRLAMDGGWHEPILRQDEIPGLVVEDGALIDSYRGECGAAETRSLIFRSEADEQELRPYAELEPLDFESHGLLLVAAKNEICLDDASTRKGPRMWAAFAPENDD